jgi:hypothetical protein
MPISFYALVTPLGRSDVGGGERPDQGLPGQPPGINIPTFPAHPIVIPPDGIAPGVPSHPIFIPPIVEIPGFPTPPIYIPPDAIAPGVPSHPIVYPPHPDQGLPGSQPHPDQGLPPSGGPSQGGERPDNTLPGSQPGVDNTLPPVIEFPPLPDIPDDAKAIVLVKMRGQEAEWMYVTEGDELKPIDGEVGGEQPTKKSTAKRK